MRFATIWGEMDEFKTNQTLASTEAVASMYSDTIAVGKVTPSIDSILCRVIAGCNSQRICKHLKYLKLFAQI